MRIIKIMNELQKLLNEIGKIKKSNDNIANATGNRFNVFGVLGVDHYETQHSKILAEFLNPQGSHGSQELFLKEFVKQNIEEEFEFDCKNAKVYTEYYAQDKGRLDILIEQKDGKKAIIIENKVYAQDSDKQLIRYKEFAKKYGKNNYKILYLTLYGNEASMQSADGVKYKTLSYANDIIKWLEECAKISIHKAMARETINQYVNHLKQLTGQDMTAKEQEKLVEVCLKNDENLKNAFEIAEKIGEIKSKLLHKNLIEISENFPLDFDEEKKVFSSLQWKSIGIEKVVIVENNGKIDVEIHTKKGEEICSALNNNTIFQVKEDRVDLKSWKVITYEDFSTNCFLKKVFEKLKEYSEKQ